jgi:hypothetical protein
MHPKDPRQHGWKYKSFNYNDVQHAEVKDDLNFITKMTGGKEKIIVKDLIHKERKRLENEQGDHNTITA